MHTLSSAWRRRAPQMESSRARVWPGTKQSCPIVSAFIRPQLSPFAQSSLQWSFVFCAKGDPVPSFIILGMPSYSVFCPKIYHLDRKESQPRDQRYNNANYRHIIPYTNTPLSCLRMISIFNSKYWPRPRNNTSGLPPVLVNVITI